MLDSWRRVLLFPDYILPHDMISSILLWNWEHKSAFLQAFLSTLHIKDQPWRGSSKVRMRMWMMIKDRKLWCKWPSCVQPHSVPFFSLCFIWCNVDPKIQKFQKGKLNCGLGLSNLTQKRKKKLQHNFPPQLQWDIRKKEATKQDAPSFPLHFGCHDNTLRKEKKDKCTSRIKTVAHIRALSL